MLPNAACGQREEGKGSVLPNAVSLAEAPEHSWEQ